MSCRTDEQIEALPSGAYLIMQDGAAMQNARLRCRQLGRVDVKVVRRHYETLIGVNPYRQPHIEWHWSIIPSPAEMKLLRAMATKGATIVVLGTAIPNWKTP